MATFYFTDGTAAEPGNILCSLSQLQALTSTQAGKIRYSVSYKNLTHNSGNQGSGRLLGVEFDDDYAGSEKFIVTFTDTTSFEFRERNLGLQGVGDIFTNFVSASGKVFIDSSNWSGVFVANDVFNFESDSNISDVSARDVITSIGWFVYGKLTIYFNDKDTIDQFLTDSTVALEVMRVYLQHYSGYKVYLDIYPELEKDKLSPVNHWYVIANDSFDIIMRLAQEKSNRINSPRWISRDQLITEVGVAGVGAGVIDISSITRDKRFNR